MTAPIDPRLLAAYSAGSISYAEFQEAQKRVEDDNEDRYKVAALQQHVTSTASSGGNVTAAQQTVNAELALLAESRRMRQERDARLTAERIAKEKRNAAIASTQRAIDLANLQTNAKKDTAEIAQRQAELERMQQDAGNVRTVAVMQERQREETLRAPIEWEDLSSQQQGYTIADELARRRATIAAEMGDTITDTRPAYQIAPLVPNEDAALVQLPDFTPYYVPAPAYGLGELPIPAGPDLSGGGYSGYGDVCGGYDEFNASLAPLPGEPGHDCYAGGPAEGTPPGALQGIPSELIGEQNPNIGYTPPNQGTPKGISGGNADSGFDWNSLWSWLDTAGQLISEGGEVTAAFGPGLEDLRLTSAQRTTPRWLLPALVVSALVWVFFLT